MGHRARVAVRCECTAAAAAGRATLVAPIHRIVHPCRLVASERKPVVSHDFRAAGRTRSGFMALSIPVSRRWRPGESDGGVYPRQRQYADRRVERCGIGDHRRLSWPVSARAPGLGIAAWHVSGIRAYSCATTDRLLGAAAGRVYLRRPGLRRRGGLVDSHRRFCDRYTFCADLAAGGCAAIAPITRNRFDLLLLRSSFRRRASQQRSLSSRNSASLLSSSFPRRRESSLILPLSA